LLLMAYSLHFWNVEFQSLGVEEPLITTEIIDELDI